jgi:CheY-like chemotaxis protein
MTAQQWLQLTSTLVNGLAWPAALVICLLVFRRPLRRFLGDLSEFSFKTAGLEASAKRGQVAVAAVAAAEASRGTMDGDAGPGAQPNLEDIEKVLPGKWAQRRIEGARVLWVDDHPQNNRYERQALEALGIRIDLSTSTETALELAEEVPYRLIISDMGRPHDPQAGFTLLAALKRQHDEVPVVFYTGSASKADVAEARKRGAVDRTASPRELVAIVTEVLGRDY